MSNFRVGIDSSLNSQRKSIVQFLSNIFRTSRFVDIEGEIDISQSQALLSQNEVDLYISPYETDQFFPLEKSPFLVTTLPGLMKLNTGELNIELSTGFHEVPFSVEKNCITFLRSRQDLIKLLSPFFGTVSFVGAGAGQKELLTIKGQSRVQEAQLIISDFLLDQQMLKAYANKDAQVVPLSRFGRHGSTQDKINETILHYALLYEKVVRLKGGDSFVFGRGGEECESIHFYNIGYEIIPGISALLSALSYAGIPLTHRDFNGGFIVITGYRRECEDSYEECQMKIAEKINFAISHQLMAVLFMSMGNWKNFVHLIERQDFPVALIESGAYPNQRVNISTVKDAQELIEKEQFKSPTLIAIGQNVKNRDKMKWYENLPLFGTKIVSFASEMLSIEIDRMLSDLGANLKSFELYDLVPENIEEIKPYIENLSQYDYLIITSRNAFDILFQMMYKLRIDIRNIPKVIVTGKKTEEEFKALGIYPDIVPETFSSDGIIDALKTIDIKNKRFLFPKSSLSKGNLSEYICESGGVLTEFVLYQNQPKQLSSQVVDDILGFNADYIIFTSSSSVDYYFKNLQKSLPSDFTAISIGNKTTETLKKKNVTSILEPLSFTIEGIKQLLFSRVSSKNND